jgi:GNAT superfamily N-acetyltransferase
VTRTALPTDADAVLALTHELADFPVPAWRTADEIRRADRPILQAALAGTPADQLLLVAEAEGRLVGFVFVVTNRDYFTGEPHAYVEDLVTAPEARGKGVARALMDEAEGWARAQGHRRIRLAVWAQNERARTLYQRRGYQPETMYYLKEL